MQLPVKYDDVPIKDRRLVREAYIEKQKGLCAHCGEPLDKPAPDSIMKLPIKRRLFPPKFFVHPVHLHHDHNTGMTIGAVHSRCNAVLFQYFDE